MGVLETALLVLGFAGVAGFTSLAVYFGDRVFGRRSKPALAVPELAAALQPADAPLKVHVLGDTGFDEAGTRFVVEGVSDRLTLRREHRPEPRADVAPPGGPPPAPELEIGDPDFDGAFFVLGPATLVYALLDAETRRLLTRLTADAQPGEVVVERGVLTVSVGLSHRVDPRGVAARGREVVALARRLLKPGDVAARLAENARRDPLPAVRLANLGAAVREDPANPMTRAMLLAAATDGDVDVRLRAGLALGVDGTAALISVADDPAADDAAVETALKALGPAAALPLLTRVVSRAVTGDGQGAPSRPRTARACADALAVLASPDAVSQLRGLLVSGALPDDAARALGRVGGPAAEAALIDALDSNRLPVCLAAVAVLRDSGSAAAVETLRQAERRGGELRRLARVAIAEIQSRLTGAPGEVSLADGSAGQVSLAPGSAGRVSLAAAAAEPPKAE